MALSLVAQNAMKDPTYAPFCLPCPRIKRMLIVEPFYWRCVCGAEHDERANIAQHNS